MTVIEQTAAVVGYISTILTAIVILVKPVREKVLGMRNISSGMKCLLRADMLRMYYKHHAERAIRQHERENFEAEYRAYKSLGGNSFIDDIYGDIKDWSVET